jgi:hypothetical protein
MITPVWDTTYSVRRGWTTFHLQLSESEDGALLSHQIGNIKPSLLLFLRRLRSLQIDVAVSNRSHNKQIRFEHNDTDEHISRLKRFEDDQCVLDDNYFVFKHTAGTFTREPRRENIKQTEIVLAFPVTGNEAPEIRKNEEVHAFLPLGCFGFTVGLLIFLCKSS